MISLIAASSVLAKELPYSRNELIFQSMDAVQDARKEFLTRADNDLNRFVELSNQGNYSTAYQVWSDLLFTYFSLTLEFGRTKELTFTDSVKTAAITQRELLDKDFQEKLLSHPTLLPTFLKNGQADQNLTPQHRLFTEQILTEYQELNPKEAQKIGAVLDKMTSKNADSFSIERGEAKPLSEDSLQKLKVLTANICCFPGTLSYMYGGIRPWRERLDKLTEVIVNSGAEVVFLQEVWDPEAMRAFIDKLKGEYAIFVYDAGDPAGTVNVNKMGYNSGLFVASKLPLDSIAFNRFPRSIPEGSNRGAIVATCRVAQERIALVNTHLNHTGGTQKQKQLMREVRKEQLLLCYGYLQEVVSKALPKQSWGLVGGDFNIDAADAEFNDCGLSTLFSIPYANNPSAEQPTWTDYFNDLVRTPFDQRSTVKPVNELVDYCIRPTLSNVTPISTQTMIPLYDLEKPLEALSDHQALLTSWTVNSKK